MSRTLCSLTIPLQPDPRRCHEDKEKSRGPRPRVADPNSSMGEMEAGRPVATGKSLPPNGCETEHAPFFCLWFLTLGLSCICEEEPWGTQMAPVPISSPSSSVCGSKASLTPPACVLCPHFCTSRATESPFLGAFATVDALSSSSQVQPPHSCIPSQEQLQKAHFFTQPGSLHGVMKSREAASGIQLFGTGKWGGSPGQRKCSVSAEQ